MILPRPEPTADEAAAIWLEEKLLAPLTGNIIADTCRYTPDDKYASGAVHALLTRMVCPVVCRGYLDGSENWHNICLHKADDVMRQLGMTPPTRPAPPTAPQPQEGTS